VQQQQQQQQHEPGGWRPTHGPLAVLPYGRPAAGHTPPAVCKPQPVGLAAAFAFPGRQASQPRMRQAREVAAASELTPQRMAHLPSRPNLQPSAIRNPFRGR
jgi:hypothetical protein